MNRFDVPVGPIHMVMTVNVSQKLLEKKQRFPFLPDPGSWLGELQQMNLGEGIPAIIKNREGKNQLVLYTTSYYLVLYESSRGDGYTVGYIDTLNLHEHELLSKGALRIRANSLHQQQELKFIPPGSDNYWNVIYQAWQHFEVQRQQTNQQKRLTHAHEQFLDTVEDLIEVTHRLEQDKSNLNASIPYRKVETAGEVRDAPRDTYIFRLVEISALNEKSMLRIREVPDLQGRVLMLEGTKLTFKFEGLVDRKLIPEQGSFEPMISSSIYKKQLEAVIMLRERTARNSHLLPVIVDHAYQPYQPDRITQNADIGLRSLTSEQFEAFQRALAVPDLLMILGPPGTGKTRTITEIALHSGLRHQRVLMTSGTHKAVDNVLERMPEDLIVIRVGYEDKVSEKMRGNMIDAKAQEMQGELLKQTERHAIPLSWLISYGRELDAWLYQLTQGVEKLTNNETNRIVLSQQKSIVEQRIIAPLKQQYNDLGLGLQQQKRVEAHAQKSLGSWEKKQVSAEAKSQMPLLGWIFTMLLKRALSHIEREKQVIQQQQYAIWTIQQEQKKLYEAGQQQLLADLEYGRHSHAIQRLSGEHETLCQELLKIAKRLQATIVDLAPHQPPLEPYGAATLQRYLSWFKQTKMLLERRAHLLRDWRAELEQATDQLYPELLQYADVVGATCIGAATAKGLQAVEFDLVIVDEAGQIALPDLLVPLVRAKRAVLVGDHNQLPPFVDDDVKTWLKNLSSQVPGGEDEEVDAQQISDLLTKSAFERLFMTVQGDSTHLVRFTRQGRMPQVIADFASRHFYANQLGTFNREKMGHTIERDPLFLSPLIIVDMADAPENIKRERKQKNTEDLGVAGYINVAEAMLIADLAEMYQKAEKEWVVIVPYRAQARLIIQELHRRIDAYDFALEERVATVDSFQGGERKKVIYGFTRNNMYGEIGFLKELRRLNVAMTRAQQHLILVGDFSTLTQANDAHFKYIVTDLKEYVAQNGELVSYTACRTRLQKVLERKVIR